MMFCKVREELGQQQRKWLLDPRSPKCQQCQKKGWPISHQLCVPNLPCRQGAPKLFLNPKMWIFLREINVSPTILPFNQFSLKRACRKNQIPQSARIIFMTWVSCEGWCHVGWSKKKSELPES